MNIIIFINIHESKIIQQNYSKANKVKIELWL